VTWDTELEGRLRKIYGATTVKEQPTPARAWSGEDSFVTEVSDRFVFTTPARTFSAVDELPETVRARWNDMRKNPFFSWVQGRYVQAEQANSNGAFWSTGDLEFGNVSIQHGPLNWLHQSQKVIGTIADATLIKPESEQASMNKPYIAATAAMWKWVYPEEVQDVEQASNQGKLFYSMEAVAEKIQCIGGNGCGESFEYMTAMRRPGDTCEHIANRTSIRRLENPTFLGGAVIVPPVQPGWKDANATVMASLSQMAADTESANVTGLSDAQWEGLMQMVVAFASH
jgi:hypothetical protein